MSKPKPEGVNRKAFVAGAAGLAASIALPATAAAGDESRAAEASGEIAERLRGVAQGLEQTGARLDRIDAVLINPPDPERPAIRDALVQVKTEAERIVVTADDMLRRV